MLSTAEYLYKKFYILDKKPTLDDFDRWGKTLLITNPELSGYKAEELILIGISAGSKSS